MRVLRWKCGRIKTAATSTKATSLLHLFLVVAFNDGLDKVSVAATPGNGSGRSCICSYIRSLAIDGLLQTAMLRLAATIRRASGAAPLLLLESKAMPADRFRPDAAADPA